MTPGRGIGLHWPCGWPADGETLCRVKGESSDPRPAVIMAGAARDSQPREAGALAAGTSPTGSANSRTAAGSRFSRSAAVEWELFLADAVVETHDRIVGRTYREAARTCEGQLGDETAAGPRGAPGVLLEHAEAR